MSVQNWAVMTAEQHTFAETLDDDENYVVGGRVVDGAAAGVGINLNPSAVGIAAGAVVEIVGMYVVAVRMVYDPDCATYAPDLRDFLMTLPWALLDSDVVFAPPPP